MKRFLKRYCWLIVYGVFLIVDLAVATFLANKSGIGRIEGDVSSGFWPFMIASSTLGSGVSVFYCFLSPFILYATLVIYFVLYLIKKSKKEDTKDFMQDFLCIVTLLFLGFAGFSALSVTPLTQSGLFFFKGDKEFVIMYVLLAWLLILVSRITVDLISHTHQKKLSQK